MTTYNTGNPVPSTEVKDLYDNAENLDSLVNGAAFTHEDRLGVPRKTWAGIEEDFQQFLLNSGYQFIGDYDSGPLNITARNQIFTKDGEFWRAAAALALPYVTIENWAVDQSNFVSVGDAALRQDLAGDAGGSFVETLPAGAGAIRRSLKERIDDDRTVFDFGAAGDGVTNDDAAFAAFEAALSAGPVNLFGRTFVVSAVPSKNAYYNGTWLVGGDRRIALLKKTFLDGAPKVHRFGGQLRDLRRDLGKPLVQYLGVVFIGDSITWGTGATGTNNPDPRDGTLSDPRDFYDTASYVNEFKRYVQQRYAPLASPILSNHPASGSGESTVEYQKEHIMYPRYGDFTVTQAAGASMSITDVFNSSIVGGGQLRLSSANVGVENSHSITFDFTGSEFRVYFSCVNADATFYELLVGGVSQGVFSMKAGAVASSGVVADGQVGAYYDHAITFARDVEITIRTKRNGDAGSRIARFNAVRVLKRTIIKNQGINGSSARVYGLNNLSGSFGDGVAVEPEDTYVFCQLGTNDRAVPGANQYARGPNIFTSNLGVTLGYLTGDHQVILMVGPPAIVDGAPTMWFGMRDVRDAILRVAQAGNWDMIDNFSTFNDVDMNQVTTDGLHPDDLGHALIVRNIVNALEDA